MMSRALRTPTHNATLAACLCKAGYSCIPPKSAATSLWTIRDVKVVLMVKMARTQLVECWGGASVAVFAAVIDETGVFHQALCFHQQTHRKQVSETVLGYPLSHSLVLRRNVSLLFFDLIFGTLDRHVFSHTCCHETVNGEVSWHLGPQPMCFPHNEPSRCTKGLQTGDGSHKSHRAQRNKPRQTRPHGSRPFFSSVHLQNNCSLPEEHSSYFKEQRLSTQPLHVCCTN